MIDSEVFVNFDTGATPDEVRAAKQILDEVGYEAIVSDQPYSLTASGADVVLDPFVVVATWTASGFLTAMAGRAGLDAYDAIKRLVTRLRAVRSNDQGRLEIIIRGEDGGPDIVIAPETPDQALGELLRLKDLPATPSGKLEYDLGAHQWKDPEAI
jgi:hypothetical protein